MFWEERRLRVFENRVLRRIFGPKRNEVTGEWRNLHKEKHSDQVVNSAVYTKSQTSWRTLKLEG